MSVRSVLAVAMALAAAPLTVSPHGFLANDSGAMSNFTPDAPKAFGNGMATREIVPATPALAGSTPTAGDAIELRGIGAQVYSCEISPSGFGWRLKAPEATLLDSAGAEFGRHFAGPSWQARDGSTIVGEVMASNPAPQPGSIPWLLLRAKSHAGGGAFASVGYIARIRTSGGLAPADGCDAAHAGAERRVAYSALYVFFSQP
jgi:hypothetical protein